MTHFSDVFIPAQIQQRCGRDKQHSECNALPALKSYRKKGIGAYSDHIQGNQHQWEFQDPKIEVLYHIRPYFVGIFPYIGLKNRPYIWQVPPIQVPENPIVINGGLQRFISGKIIELLLGQKFQDLVDVEKTHVTGYKAWLKKMSPICGSIPFITWAKSRWIIPFSN